MRTDTLKNLFAPGTRIESLWLNDNSLPIGSRGTVKEVNDLGMILVEWDNGSNRPIMYGLDVVKIIEQGTQICEYCDPVLTDDCIQKELIDEPLNGGIFGDMELIAHIFDNQLNIGIFYKDGREDICRSTKIRFCPMCGRKLM